MSSELQEIDRALANRRNTYLEDSLLTAEEKQRKLSELYGEWVANDKYDKVCRHHYESCPWFLEGKILLDIG